MRRELKSVDDKDTVLGAVDDRFTDPFVGGTREVLAALIRRMGEDKVVESVLKDGWSNGYLFFDEPQGRSSK